MFMWTDFYDFFSFDLKSSSELNGKSLKFLKFQERVELEPDITKGPQEKNITTIV